MTSNSNIDSNIDPNYNYDIEYNKTQEVYINSSDMLQNILKLSPYLL